MNRHLPMMLVTATFLSLPLVAHAQEATITGTVTDSTGGVLPGVTIKAVNEASGNNFEAVTDARGAYLLAVRIGGYQITATLAGFGTVTRSLELLERTAEQRKILLSKMAEVQRLAEAVPADAEVSAP